MTTPWMILNLINSSFNVSSSIYSLGSYFIINNTKKKELEKVNQNQETLYKIEKDLKQWWAIQSGMIDISNPELLQQNNFNDIILIDKNGHEIVVNFTIKNEKTSDFIETLSDQDSLDTYDDLP